MERQTPQLSVLASQVMKSMYFEPKAEIRMNKIVKTHFAFEYRFKAS